MKKIRKIRILDLWFKLMAKKKTTCQLIDMQLSADFNMLGSLTYLVYKQRITDKDDRRIEKSY